MSEQLLADFLDDREQLSGVQFAELLSAIRGDPAMAETLRQTLVMDDLLCRTIGSWRGNFQAQVAMRIQDLATPPAARRNATYKVVAGTSVRNQPAGPVLLLRKRRVFRFGWGLAVAASLAIVAGGVWWSRLGGVAEGVGLRVVEVAGEVNVQPSTFNSQEPNGERNGSRAVVGQELRQGDRVAVKPGGKVGLKYDGEATTIDLHSAVALFSAERGAKRVRLDSGLLLCTAAPQAKPFRLETPNGVATVEGTEFALDVARRETTLVVYEGTVALSKGANRLAVSAGEVAGTDEKGLRKGSAADAWLKDLAIHAETGPWDAVDFGKGVFAQGNWRMDARGSAAECLLWNVNPGSGKATGVAFDTARWRRGILMGSFMFVGDGTPEPVLPVETTNSNPQMSVFGMNVSGESADKPLGVMLYRGLRDRIDAISVRIMEEKSIAHDVWHKLILYFDMDAEGGPVHLFAFWPEAGGGVPAASEWTRGQPGDLPRGTPVGLGLVVAPNFRVVVKGLKFVPQGADMPRPPAGLLDR